MKRGKPLKRGKGINKVSEKKKREILEEKDIRRQLEARAGGLCELCHQKPDFRELHPHEKRFRSHGGKMTMKNTEMLCGRCHNKKHGIKEA